MPNIAKRVQRGMAFLDEARPDWRKHVNPVTLDINSATDCVLGQLARAELGDKHGFWYMKSVLGLSSNSVKLSKLGFANWDGVFTDEELNDEWGRQLA
jgi:hypothetical protein